MLRVFVLMLLCAASGAVCAPSAPEFTSFTSYAQFSFSALTINLTVAYDEARDIAFAGYVFNNKVYFEWAQQAGISYMSQGDPANPSKFLCRAETREIFSMFSLSFIKNSTAVGQTTHNGMLCDVFESVLDECHGGILPMTNCQIHTYVPVTPVPGLTLAAVIAKVTASGIPMTWSLEFFSMTPTSDIPSYIAIQQPCLAGPPPPICPAGPVIQNFTTYKNQEASDGITNENTADAVGEAFWLCSHTFKYPNNHFVSSFSVDANSTWGLYGFCNEQECMNPSPHTATVGRQCPACNEIGKLGQCDPNAQSGSWYSWPKYVRCDTGRSQSVSSGECAWSYNGFVKSITIECLNDRGFYNICPKQTQTMHPLSRKTAPLVFELASIQQYLQSLAPQQPHVTAQLDYSAAAKIMVAAFASEDPARGGCPNVAAR